ncbi:hypothetical protein NDU88_003250 [Pleurodeles waltl]|uniref:Uncharacterized protein n=1 Tax=Pleurodeles waltl TaxID=8319 RepID=A0AAV7MQ08_PLEWA|nr:hypothetical protein NDU88_003250 [Pleurodeles waltl]
MMAPVTHFPATPYIPDQPFSASLRELVFVSLLTLRQFENASCSSFPSVAETLQTDFSLTEKTRKCSPLRVGKNYSLHKCILKDDNY